MTMVSSLDANGEPPLKFVAKLYVTIDGEPLIACPERLLRLYLMPTMYVAPVVAPETLIVDVPVNVSNEAVPLLLLEQFASYRRIWFTPATGIGFHFGVSSFVCVTLIVNVDDGAVMLM